MSAKRHIIPIFIPHLGCPNSCVFCDQKHIAGAAAPPSARDVGEAIAEALEKIPAARGVQAAFYGGSFTAIALDEMAAYLEAAKPFLQSGKVASLRVSTRPDAIDDKRLGILLRAGVKTVELGVQSMDEGVLLKARRGHTAGDVKNAAEMIRRSGFELILQMMCFLPGDTRESSLFTARELAAMKPDGVRIYPAVVLAGTELAGMYERGEYAAPTLGQAAELCGELLQIFHAAGIPVIRLGLNPTADLSGGLVLAGAYHSALGEMARSEVYLKKARELLLSSGCGQSATIEVGRRYVSAMVGHKRANIYALMRDCGLKSLKVTGADRGEFDLAIV